MCLGVLNKANAYNSALLIFVIPNIGQHVGFPREFGY